MSNYSNIITLENDSGRPNLDRQTGRLEKAMFFTILAFGLIFIGISLSRDITPVVGHAVTWIP